VRNRAKVVRNRLNLDKIVMQAIGSLGDTLEHAPPKRKQARFNFVVDVRIEEVGRRGSVVATYHCHHRTQKAFSK